MIQVIPELAPSTLDLSGLGANIGAGVNRGIDNQVLSRILQQAQEQGAETPDLINNILGSSVSPDIKKQAIDVLQKQELFQQKEQQIAAKEAPEPPISPLTARVVARISAGGEPATEEELAQMTDKEVKLVLRTKEVVSPIEAKESEFSLKRSGDFLKDLDTKAANAFEVSQGLELQKQAVLTGDIGQFSGAALGDLFGIPGLDNPASAVFKQGTAAELGGVKEAFGGRINQLEFGEFIKTLPQLFQNDTTKLAAIEVMQLRKGVALEMQKAANAVEEAGGNAIQARRAALNKRDEVADTINKKVSQILKLSTPAARKAETNKLLFGE